MVSQQQNQFVARLRCHGACIAVCLTLAGCGSSGPERVPVSGRITYGGSDWPAEGLVMFNCIEPEAGFPRATGIGRFDRQRNYVVRDQTGTAEGIYPGAYKIQIECWETPPDIGGFPGKSYVPAAFARSDNASLTAHVQPKTPLIHNFDVPTRSD